MCYKYLLCLVFALLLGWTKRAVRLISFIRLHWTRFLEKCGQHARHLFLNTTTTTDQLTTACQLLLNTTTTTHQLTIACHFFLNITTHQLTTARHLLNTTTTTIWINNHTKLGTNLVESWIRSSTISCSECPVKKRKFTWWGYCYNRSFGRA